MLAGRAGHALAAEPSTQTGTEIKYLLDYLEQSGCQFNRNGSWYDGKAARKHLQDKADYLNGRKLIGTAEDFIEKGATESSVSGKAYQVKCGSDAAVPSAVWLSEELARYRKSRPQ
jgi:hypothetical protein